MKTKIKMLAVILGSLIVLAAACKKEDVQPVNLKKPTAAPLRPGEIFGEFYNRPLGPIGSN